MTQSFKKIIAIDYGEKNIGLAYTESLIPEALPAIKAHDYQDTLHQLTAIISSLSPDLVIIGLPEGRLVKTIHNLAKDLETNSHIPTITHPETLTTQEAKSKLKEAGASSHKLSQDDSFAACLILTDYLDGVYSSIIKY